ncbi:MAG: bifunctional nuclease family protein [Methanobacteriota archaeon]|nr:MAG: bifunctional nuclease family protein [Euryarchaeota archaeon]
MSQDHDEECEPDSVRVKITGVFVANTPDAPSPVVFLESDEKRVLPIYIGASEAFSIQTALDNTPYPRPLTHDLFLNILENTGLQVEKIIIDDLSEGVFFSRLIIRRNGDRVEFDARPSDCIALAVRTNAPVYVSRDVMDTASVDKGEYEIE